MLFQTESFFSMAKHLFTLKEDKCKPHTDAHSNACLCFCA